MKASETKKKQRTVVGHFIKMGYDLVYNYGKCHQLGFSQFTDKNGLQIYNYHVNDREKHELAGLNFHPQGPQPTHGTHH